MNTWGFVLLSSMVYSQKSGDFVKQYISRNKSVVYFNCILLVVVYFLMTTLFVSMFGMSNIIATFVAEIIMIFFCIWRYVSLRKKYDYENFLKPRFSWSFPKTFVILGFSLIFAYALIVVMYKMSVMMPDPNMTSRQNILKSIINTYGLPFYVFVSCIIAPIAEECMYRLFMYNSCIRVSGIVPSIMFSSFLFGLSHMTFLHAVFSTLFGIFLVCIYEFSGRKIIFCIMTHILYNLMSIFLPVSAVDSDNVFFIASSIVLFATVTLFLWYVLFKGNEQRELAKPEL